MKSHHMPFSFYCAYAFLIVVKDPAPNPPLLLARNINDDDNNGDCGYHILSICNVPIPVPCAAQATSPREHEAGPACLLRTRALSTACAYGVRGSREATAEY